VGDEECHGRAIIRFVSLDGGVEEVSGFDVEFCGGVKSLERDKGDREGDRGVGRGGVICML
jgi:hypothetical protein